jgi:glucosamine-6-phosphate deaminase
MFVVDAREEADRVVAEEIASLVRAQPASVLGLATGNTPIGVYRELIRLHRAGAASFARASTFNLDEFLELSGGHESSFRSWMHAHLFAHVDLAHARAHVPELGSASDERDACSRYEQAITAAGGIDVQILGIGRNGHIGFNEPGSPRDSRTRAVELHPSTREDAAKAFGGLENVPKRALTMGVATILDARRIRVLAFGARKAEIVKRTLHDPVSSACPSTFLRGHRDVKLYVDRAALG